MTDQGRRSRSAAPRGRFLAAVVALLLLAACAAPNREMTDADARLFTERALEEMGFSRISVEERVVPGVYPPRGARSVPVWTTRARVEGGTIELAVMREGDRAVFVQDQDDDGGELLTDQQFEVLERFRYNPAAERARQEKLVPAIVAVIVLVGAVAASAAAGWRQWRRRPV